MSWWAAIRLSTGNLLAMAQHDYLSVTQVAEMLGITRQAVLKRIRAGRLRALKVGHRYVVPREAVGQASGQSDPIVAEIVRRLVSAYEPDRIYLFGSTARGDPGRDSPPQRSDHVSYDPSHRDRRTREFIAGQPAQRGCTP